MFITVKGMLIALAYLERYQEQTELDPNITIAINNRNTYSDNF
jgi:hypothetical protein